MSTPLATLLVIDDDEDSEEALSVLLRISGYSVIPAHSAAEALDVLDERNDIDLVISDIRMPGVDGLDLIRVVRHRFPALRTILVSGASLTDDDVLPREASSILSKPVSIEELKRAISTTLGRS
ncbi:MAG TPA: response regulator [Casimicrobiaceae bacterium]|jgi:CheY-like chemotaxis protein|nr:response regulator [Casimicrobiaceae bacterium]